MGGLPAELQKQKLTAPASVVLRGNLDANDHTVLKQQLFAKLNLRLLIAANRMN
jgi:hypothetical protein